MSEQMTRGEIHDLLSKFSAGNPKYRAALLKNPRAVLEGQLNTKIPTAVTIKAVEETPNTMYIVVPWVPKKGGELDDASLETVAGGAGKGDQTGNTYDCHAAMGGQNTRNEFNADVKLA